MPSRPTFYSSATDLAYESERFRSAFSRPERDPDRAGILEDASRRGVQLLRSLALAVRSEQDYGLLPMKSQRVGSVLETAAQGEIEALVPVYRPPYATLHTFAPLDLRNALNKIAHATPAPLRSGVYADAVTHDMISSGTRRGCPWIAVISVLDVCRVLQALPDRLLQP